MYKFDKLQTLGRALMLPIALLPVAGLLLRLGQPDLLNIAYIAQAGNVIFSNLPTLFAVGVAIGIAKNNNGVAALSALVGYYIMSTILAIINKDINTGVLGGILIGSIAASIYNRYYQIKLPEYLAFFGGKRFVPIATGLLAVLVGIILGYIWPPIQIAINTFGGWLLASGAFGLFIYGVINRFLLITGLHHVLNNLVWFVFGDFTNSYGVLVHGDIARFMAGDKQAGSFMAGFFPIMMFGLPGACLAMYKNALPSNKKAVAGLLISMALTSFITGVTEPIEFTFVFLAPLLFVVHALLTGLSLALMYLLNVHLGFTFSAGLIDYVLFYKLATNPLLLLPVGLGAFLLYFLLFDFFIRKYDLKTIGRTLSNDSANDAMQELKANEDVQENVQDDVYVQTHKSNQDNNQENNQHALSIAFVQALGGANNIVQVDACTTRLRLKVVNATMNIDKERLLALGAKGVLTPSNNTLQVVLGPQADAIASDINDYLSTLK